MRDRVIAVLDVTWFVGLVVFAFTWSTVALVSAGVLMAAAMANGWRDRNERRSRTSWRYWTEPRVDQATHWSPTYWGTLTLACLLLGVPGYLVDPAPEGSLPGTLFMTLAVLAAFGWWRLRHAASAAGRPAEPKLR